MNWGQKLAAVYLGFVAFMGCLVWLCVKQDDIHLVSEDYYRQEIAYQDNINQRANVSHLKEKLIISYDSSRSEVLVSIPSSLNGATGLIQFYRPSDARKDFTQKLETTHGQTQRIPANHLDSGHWILKTRWQKDQKVYYQEDKILI